MRAGARRAARAAALCSVVLATRAQANGRMPGATDLVVSKTDARHLVVRATFGLVRSTDGGATWRWICEQAVGVSGEADPPLAVLPDEGIVLLPPTGGALVSRDGGCSFTPAEGPPEGRRNVDLTVDPGDPAHVIVVTSTVADVDPQGVVSYENVLIESRDAASLWTEVSSLPADFVVETVEVAASDPNRIYVSGTASSDPLRGIVERSDDGGHTWTRTLVGLPQGSGSLFISAIHPTNADRLWIRVPARGDVFGFFPATLLSSTDGGETFTVLASTERAMFGLALSPDGERLAYGGPSDGLFVGPASGGAFTKVSSVGVRCLEWEPNGLYVCGSEPREPFTIGISPGADGVFTPTYVAKDTCPESCAKDAGVLPVCAAPWATIGPSLGARTTCDITDAGFGSGGEPAKGGGGNEGSGGGVSLEAGPESGGTDGGPSGGRAPTAKPDVRASGGCSTRPRPASGIDLVSLALAVAGLSSGAVRRKRRLARTPPGVTPCCTRGSSDR